MQIPLYEIQARRQVRVRMDGIHGVIVRLAPQHAQATGMTDLLGMRIADQINTLQILNLNVHAGTAAHQVRAKRQGRPEWMESTG
jgi:hypothetical protein